MVQNNKGCTETRFSTRTRPSILILGNTQTQTNNESEHAKDSVRVKYGPMKDNQ